MELNGCHVIATRSTHAVQAAMFVLELPAPIPTEIIQKASQHYENTLTLKEFFPIKAENRGMLINITHEAFDVNQSDGINGITLQRVGIDGIPEYIFSMQDNQIAFTCNKYTRWKEISPIAIDFLNQFSSFVCPVPGIAVIALQYVDEFLVTGNLPEYRSSILFNTKTKRLPTTIFDGSDFWHNHAGWFETNENKERILNNLNISYHPQQPDRNAVQIVTAHKEILKTPILDHSALRNLMTSSFESLHTMNKEMFKEFLNTETLNSIGLN